MGAMSKMNRPGQAISALGAVMGNTNLRRVELAWGAVDRRRVGALRRTRCLRLRRRRRLCGRDRRSRRACSRLRSSRRSPAPSATVSGASASSSRSRWSEALPSPARPPPSSTGATRSLDLRAGRRRRDRLDALPAGAAGDPARRSRGRRQELIAANGATSTIESLGTLVGPLLRRRARLVRRPGRRLRGGGGHLLAASLLLAPLHVEGVIQATAADRGDACASSCIGGFRAVRGPARA